MKPEQCYKLNECNRVKIVLDKDMEDFQYARYIRTVCENCQEFRNREQICGDGTMVISDVVEYHLREAIRAGLAEMRGSQGLAKCLRAETKMQLINMSEEELRELASVVCPPHKVFEQVYVGFKEVIDELKTSPEAWMKDLKIDDNVLDGGEG